MVIKWNSVEDADGTVPLGVGFTIVTVEVTAQDGTTTQTYIVFVKRPGVTVSPTELTVGEGGSGTYTVALDTLPSGDVTVAISSDNADVTVSSSSLTFSTSNWSAAADGHGHGGPGRRQRTHDTAMVTHDPSGADYNSVSNADLAVTVTDNETCRA